MKTFTMKNYLYFLLVAVLLLFPLPGNVIIAATGVTVSIAAPSSVSAGGKFVATVSVSQVASFNGYQLQLTYNPSLIQVDDVEGGAQGVTAGLIGGISVPVGMWTYYPMATPGVIRFLGYVPGNAAVTGSGTLAVIHFRAVSSSSHCDIIPTEVPSPAPPELPFKNILFDNATSGIPSSWAGTGVNLIPAPVVSTLALSNGEVGIAYSQNLTASGGILPLVWSVQSGTLPSGLNLNAATGNIAGTPTSAGGPSMITFNVTDSQLSSASKNLAITIVSEPGISTTSLLNGEVGVAYSQNLAATGGTQPFVWSIQSGTLPSGLSLNATSGNIAGTPTSAGGPNAITFNVMDNLLASATKTLAITILSAPSITTTSLSNGEVGVAYSQNLTATGGTQPFAWSVQTGTLPSGLNLNGATGNIAGTPTLAGGPNTITIKLTDNVSASITKDLAITILSAPSITTPSLTNGEVGVAYLQNLTATGGTPPFAWAVQSGPLPSGLSLNSTTGNIAGTPSLAGGPTNITLKVTDNILASFTKDFTIIILAAPSITTASLSNGEVGVAYSQNLIATGGTQPFVWSVQSGTLPSGLSLNSTTGNIAGTPTVAGNPTIIFKVTDSLLASSTKNLGINVLPAPAISTASLAAGQAGVAYSQNLTAAGGTPPFVWSVQSGILPSGLSLNGTTGNIAGTPTLAGGPTTITFKVTDNLLATATKDLSISVVAAPLITTSSLSNGEVGVAYSQNLAAVGGTLPFVWSVQNGILPSGLSLNATTGSITGNPAVAGGTTDITFKVTDIVLASATKNLTITVLAAPGIITTVLPNGAVGASYFYSMLGSGGAVPYTWNATGMPGGLSMSLAGIISGTPSISGNFSVNVFITDSFVPAVTRNTTFSLYIYPQLQITSSGLSDGVIGRSFSINLAASGGLAAYSWNATGLPAGLTISSNGTITGIPVVSGNFSVNVTVNDSFNPANTTGKNLPVNIYLRGDATGEGLVNMGDVILVERIILNLSPPTVAADANNDGKVDMQDVTVIERIILGIPT